MNKPLLTLTVTLTVCTTYFILRVQDLIEAPSFLSIGFLGLEVFIATCSLFYWKTLYVEKPHVDYLPEFSATEQVIADILIPTVDESHEILQKTILSALLVKGKGQIFVLDDGRRDWLNDLCLENDVVHVIRENSMHAKAGNLNNSFKFVKTEFVLVLDADMVPASNILLTAFPHFEDATVAIVQFPQEYSNTDSFQHWKRGKNWHDLSFGLIKVNPCRNIVKASYWTGSPSILRMSAISSIGGIQTGSVTEDLLTTISLMSKGFWIKSLKEVRALGLAAHDYEAFCIQRQRWAKGFFQLWWTRNNPLNQTFSVAAKMECFSDFLYQIQMSFYLFLIQVFPLVALFSIQNTTLLSDRTIIFWSISFILMNITNHVLGGSLFRMVPFQTYMRLGIFPNIWGFFESLPVFSNDIFEITPKIVAAKLKSRTVIYISLYSSLLLINATSMTISTIKLIENGRDLNLLFIFAWSFLNLAYLCLGAEKIFYTMRKRI